MPEPRDGESHDDWMQRCMSDEESRRDFEDQGQRAAFCESRWRESQDMNAKNGQAQWLRAGVSGRPARVDREANALRGYVVAQAGPFKDGRGEFDADGLRSIVRLGNAAPKGLKSRFGHPDLSSDGVGKHLGRAKSFVMGKATDARTGKPVDAVRADLHFDPTAADTPHGNLSKYVMDLAESDPDAVSSSLVLEVDEEYRRDKDGTLAVDGEGRELPPLWFPKRLHASDIVDTGDAVDGLLSADRLAHALSVGITPELQAALKWDNVVRLAGQMLDGVFAGQPRDVVEARCLDYFRRYLDRRFPPPDSATRPRLDQRAARLTAMAADLRRLGAKNSA